MTMKHKLLVVDDESANLRMLERIFKADYEVVAAQSGAEGLNLLREHDIALIISDQRMPAMTGVEFLKQAAEMRPHCVRIIVTGYTDVNALIDAINSGVVYKYVTKPWVNSDLIQTVKRALSHHESLRAQHLLNATNERLRSSLEAAEQGFVELYLELIDTRVPGAAARAERVRDIAEQIGRRLNIGPLEMKRLSQAALLHQAVDAKPDLGGDVHELRNAALRLIEHCPGLEDVAIAVRYRHEHFDGNGGFDGLSGEQIPRDSRIIAVAAALETLLSEQMSYQAAEAVIRAGAGTQFDPSVVDALSDDELSGPPVHHLSIPQELSDRGALRDM
jgi:response regulator RpfG family c-di-GMP phosphodiesterase